MLTDEERGNFRDLGYLTLAPLPKDRVEHYVAVLDQLVERCRTSSQEVPGFELEMDSEGNRIPGVLFKLQGLCANEPRMKELAQEAAVVASVRDLIDEDELDFFGTKFFPKLRTGSSSTGWHQDNYYFRQDTPRVVSAAIYLSDTDAESGCLRLVPGSHHWPIQQHTPGKHGHWAEVDESTAVDIVCPAGTVVLFSANLMHGAYDNSTDEPSYRTAWHYLPRTLQLERHPRGHPDRHEVSSVLST